MATVDLTVFDDQGFVIHFGGDTHQIDAVTFGSALVSIAEALRAINHEVNPGHSIEIAIEAVGPGSFRARIKTVKRSLKNLFSGALAHDLVVALFAAFLWDKVISPTEPPVIIVNDDSVNLHGDVVLDSKHCTQVEEWIDSGQVALLSSKTSKVVSDEKLHKVYVDWSCAEPKQKGKLSFSSFGHSENQVGPRDFAFADFNASWTAELTVTELHKFRTDSLEGWFKAVGKNRLKRKENRLFKLILGTNALTLRWRDDDISVPRDYNLSFVGPASNKEGWKTEVMSKDIAPVLYNLAKAECDGNVTISADKEAICFSYTTSTGRYDIAIRQCCVARVLRQPAGRTPKGKNCYRSGWDGKTSFSLYGPKKRNTCW